MAEVAKANFSTIPKFPNKGVKQKAKG